MRWTMAGGIVLSTLLVVLAASVAYPLVPIEPVVTGKGAQYRGFANDTYIVYTNWVRRTDDSTAYAQPLLGGPKKRLNAAHSRGVVGGIDPGTNKVILQQWTPRRSDLYFYNLDTQVRSKIPGVNSKRWEYDPLISSTFIAYAQGRRRRGDWYTSLKVYRRDGGVTRTLGTWRWGPNQVYPGSVGEKYVTYTVCTRRNCFAYLYDWESRTKQRIPTLSRRPQYAPVVDEPNSTVYFSRSSNAKCGKGVNIWRRPIPIAGGDPVVKIVDLPDGIDTGWESSLTANTGSGGMDLYIERWVCAKRTGDVYAARGVDLIPPP